MKIIPPKNGTVDVWLVYSQDDTGAYIEGAFTHKVQAEAYMRWCKETHRNYNRYWIRELTTHPHGEGQ